MQFRPIQVWQLKVPTQWFSRFWAALEVQLRHWKQSTWCEEHHAYSFCNYIPYLWVYDVVTKITEEMQYDCGYFDTLLAAQWFVRYLSFLLFWLLMMILLEIQRNNPHPFGMVLSMNGVNCWKNATIKLTVVISATNKIFQAAFDVHLQRTCSAPHFAISSNQ